MGYRLHVYIPNVEHVNNGMELGKQRNYRWTEFNDKWFGENLDAGMIYRLDLQEFLYDLNSVNVKLSRHKLYNIDKLEDMVDYAIFNGYDLYFVSY